MQAPDGAMTIKRKVQTKYKLPTINWIALKPNQVRGTIFNELDDDRLYSCIDFNDFEERFKIGSVGAVTNGESDIDGLQTFPSKRFKRPENVTLLEHTRLRNIGESVFFGASLPKKFLIILETQFRKSLQNFVYCCYKNSTCSVI